MLSLKLLVLCLIMIKWLWCVLVELAGIHGSFLCFVVAAFLNYSFQMLSVLLVIYWALFGLSFDFYIVSSMGWVFCNY